eukprot:5359970-Pleurochrysis_carterae.AAC.1
MSDVHDLVAKRKRQTRRQGLGEKVSQVVGAAYKGYRDVVRLNAFSHEEMTAIDMFGALMVIGIVSEVDCRFVVKRKAGGRVGRHPYVIEEGS